MRWMDPPGSVRRFSLAQIVQHWASALMGGILVSSAAGCILARGPGWFNLHRYAGLLALLFLGFHVAYLVLTGIRHDVSAEQVAFLPVGWEWRFITGGGRAAGPAGKYAPGEKGDYLFVLVLSSLIAASGIFLLWPSRLGVPGRAALGWIRTLHAAFAAAWVLHILLTHVAARWLESPGDFRRAIFTGRVPLSLAEERPAWIEDLVRTKVLIRAPEEAVTEDVEQSRQVRDLLEEGNRLAREGLFARASATYEEALRLFPDYSQARFNLGISRMKEARFDLAMEQFRLFMENDPFNPMVARARELVIQIQRSIEGGGSP